MAGGCREGQREVMERLRGSGPERQDSQNHLLDISCTLGSPSLPCGGSPRILFLSDIYIIKGYKSGSFPLPPLAPTCESRGPLRSRSLRIKHTRISFREMSERGGMGELSGRHVRLAPSNGEGGLSGSF